MVKKDDDNVTELLAHKGGDFREMQMSILTDRSLDTLGVLERSVEVQLRSRAMTRERGSHLMMASSTGC